MPITDYNNRYMEEASSPGKLANYQDYSADTKAAEEDIPYGAAVQLGTDGEGVTKVKASGSPYGIALAQEMHDWVNNADDQHYKKFKPVAVVRKGVIWVEAGEDVMTGEKANVSPTDGKFYASDTVTVGTIEVPTGRFKSKATAGNLVQLEINQP